MDQRTKSIPQGLKPIDFIYFIGTTEVVPFYRAISKEFFRRCKTPRFSPIRLFQDLRSVDRLHVGVAGAHLFVEGGLGDGQGFVHAGMELFCAG